MSGRNVSTSRAHEARMSYAQDGNLSSRSSASRDVKAGQDEPAGCRGRNMGFSLQHGILAAEDGVLEGIALRSLALRTDPVRGVPDFE